MTRRKFSREFKIEAVRLVTDRGVAVAQAARDTAFETGPSQPHRIRGPRYASLIRCPRNRQQATRLIFTPTNEQPTSPRVLRRPRSGNRNRPIADGRIPRRGTVAPGPLRSLELDAANGPTQPLLPLVHDAACRHSQSEPI